MHRNCVQNQEDVIALIAQYGINMDDVRFSIKNIGELGESFEISISCIDDGLIYKLNDLKLAIIKEAENRLSHQIEIYLWENKKSFTYNPSTGVRIDYKDTKAKIW